MSTSHADGLTTKEDRRLLALCAVVAASSHLPLIPEHLREVPYLGWSFIAFVVASLMASAAVLTVNARGLLPIIGMLNAGAVIVYLISRTIGLPGMSDDVGNWAEPWSIPALTSECIAIAAVLATVWNHRLARRSGLAGFSGR
jgi:hypothetical protein